jgi:L-ascorbate metabolism protein UlaG (beta-lactamase superfamily)
VDGELTFIGTATVLLRYGPFTILTDPNFLHQGQHAYLGLGLSSKRRTQPALTIDQLPDLDLCVLSHHHGDHFDRVARDGLDKDLPIVTEPHSAEKLRKQGFRRAIALETWESRRFERDGRTLDVTSTPGKHAPLPLGLLLPSVMGSVLDFDDGYRIYITGDTLFHDRLAEVPQRFPEIDLCLIHLGGTRIAGILLTMDAEQGVRCLQLVAPKRAVPIHYDDYGVFKSSLDDFRRAADAASLPTEIHYVDRGDTYRFS